jgi:5'-nucleotidase
MLILVDQDNVQAGYSARFDARFVELYGTDVHIPSERHTEFKLHKAYPEEWKERVQAIQAEAGFFDALPVIPGAVEGMRALADAGHDVRTCTAPLRMSATCTSEKFAWGRRVHGPEWVDKVIITGDKTVVRADCLVDDNPVIEGALTPTWDHILFDQAYSRITGRPVFDWSTIPARIEQIEAERRDRGVLVHDRFVTAA